MQAQYYDPVIGRFYGNDPIGFRNVDSFNRFAMPIIVRISLLLLMEEIRPQIEELRTLRVQ